MSEWFTRIALVLIGGVFGCLITVIYYSGWTVDGKVPLIQLVNLIVTGILAIIVNLVWQRSASKNSARRQLLIDHAKDLQSSLQEAYALFVTIKAGKKLSQDQIKALPQSLRHVANSMSALEHAVKYCQIKCAELPKLKQVRSKLKIAITDTPFPAGSYSADRLSIIHKHFQSARLLTTKIMFLLNDLTK